VIMVGVSYKAGVSDVRESPALPIVDGLAERGADVQYHDRLVPVIRTPHGQLMRSVAAPSGADWDLAVIHVLHPRTDNGWIGDCPRVLDATYQFDGTPHCSVV
jgi:UDP-N-acetyl-D-glucosamine dehydrogenase